MLEYIQNLPQIIGELFIKNPWGQSIWMVAFVISIVNFWFLKNKMFIWGTLVASIAWAINFFFLGALTAAVMNFFDVFKNAAALKFERSAKSMYYFMAIYLIIWFFMLYGLNIDLEKWLYFTPEYNFKSLLVTFSAVFSTFLVFKTRWVQMKAGFLLVVVAYLTYNTIFQNIWWILTDLSLWVAWIFGIWKDYREEKKLNKY